MSGFGTNPQTQQGNLNRLYTNVIVPNFPTLTVTADYMSKAQAHVTFDGDFNPQLPTASGIVSSPEPYVMADVMIGLLRSQSLANEWINQTLQQTIIGPVTVYSDSSAFQALTIAQCAIQRIDPGPFDGTDPTIRITLRGVYLINNVMWTGAASGALGALGGLGAIAGLI